MMLEHSAIEIDGHVLFERAAMPANSSHAGELEDRACFMYMLNGTNIVIEQTGATKVAKSEAMIKRCGQYVSQFLNPDGFDYCKAVAVYFHPDYIRKIYNNEIPDFIKQEATKKNVTKMSPDTFIEHYIQNLLPYFENPSLMDAHLAEVKIKELVLLLLKTDNQTSVLEFFSELFTAPKQHGFQATIANNLFNDLNIEQLAFLCNKSLSSFKRAFKEIYATSPATYIREKRIEKAKELLLTTDLRISDIAFDCGFNELSSFSHTFHKVTGLSPKAFRLSQTNKLLD